MSNDAPEKMALTSMDMTEEKRARLKRLFPEVFTDDRIDFEQLRRALGDWIEPGKERYGLNWPGKAECMKIIQAPSIATLKPARDESVNFDTTENLFIEGDNLEVLKLLQKAYFGKVKMIYIDPPYNTGKEFIYPDKYRDNLDTYLAYTGQVDDQGKRFATNTDAGGRFHANWLNMMYPRLYLARNLLREDGVIFISIDDSEQSNLKALCDLVFGSENFVSMIIWQHSIQPKGYSQIFSVHHNYILCYRKSSDFVVKVLERTEEDNKNYSNPDNDAKGPWRTGDVRNALYRPNLIYKIKTPSGKEIDPPDNGWRWKQETLQAKIKDGEIVFSEDETRIISKIYLADQDGRAPETIWFAKDAGSTRSGARDLKELFDGKAPFDTVKPSELICRMMQVAGISGDDIVLDFFAGSGATAVPIVDGRISGRYVLVQLPEFIDDSSPHGKSALELSLQKVSEITVERLKRLSKKIKSDKQGELSFSNDEQSDLGFKSFKLSASNFDIWDGDAEKAQDLARQLELHVNHIDPASGPEDILYELLLKAGFELTTRIERRTMAGKDVYAVADGALLVCLDKAITPELIDALADADPLQVICLDEGFKGNDQLKTNAVQTFKARAASRETEIVFQTV